LESFLPEQEALQWGRTLGSGQSLIPLYPHLFFPKTKMQFAYLKYKDSDKYVPLSNDDILCEAGAEVTSTIDLNYSLMFKRNNCSCSESTISIMNSLVVKLVKKLYCNHLLSPECMPFMVWITHVNTSELLQE
jgi:hypothetical protein